jgi:hypothetical protein
MLAHAFNTPTKVTRFGSKPSCCTCQNSSSAFRPWPYFTCANTMTFQVTTSQDGILLNTLQASSMLPHFAYMSTKLWKQRHQTHNHFEWAVNKQACYLEVLLNRQMP